MKKALLGALALGILAAGTAWADATPTGLDGMSWRVNVKPDGMAKDKGEKETIETITFAGGKFATNEGSKLGFGSTTYKVSRLGEKDWSFTAEQKSGAQGKHVWLGTIHDGEIRGKLVWTPSDANVLTYTFTGDGKK